ncbi:hypothetical protein TI39_contig4323g00002 [Zymoseptoria brevis]|uniref:rRNA adenine N(6)-methyltransferase n=1 Tax=Zymoseptoria brevis TaxID=1047168 RepID=A0A0F4G7P5_9PEZI|nr:hypothetical protein TI39_contig4323g00002 [Zymoseptoria brevis]
MSKKRIADAIASKSRNDTLRKLLDVSVPRGRPSVSAQVNPEQVDIVSESLCDDVLQYLAPSLKPYQGCTVIDVNPGACLWSAKLHNFLEPKRHILMEPDERYVETFIKPLLDRPNSKYFHTTLTGAHNTGIFLTNFNKLLEDERLFSPRPNPAYDDPKLRQIDTSVLLTGNLVRRFARDKGMWAHRANHTDDSNAILLVQALTALSNDALHKYGLVRQLWWVPEKAKTSVIAYNQTFRSKLTAVLDLASDITEVAGIKPAVDFERWGSVLKPGGIRSRSSAVANAGHVQVKQRMHEAGIKIPKGRKIVPAINTKLPRDFEMKDPYIIVHHTESELNKAIDELEAHVDAIASMPDLQICIIKGKKKTSGLEHFIDALHYPQSIPIAAEVQSTRSSGTLMPKEGVTASTQRRAMYIDAMMRIVNLETHAVVLREEKQTDITNIAARLFNLDKAVQNIFHTIKIGHSGLYSDQSAFFASPQSLKYDRRPFEPLQANPTEFFPESSVALLDVVPSTIDLDVSGLADRQEVSKLMHELAKLLFLYRITSIPYALDKIAPNAAQDLIPQAPSITDPRQGGRLNPEHVMVRSMTDKMLEELVKAWFEWPFKPDRFELELASTRVEQWDSKVRIGVEDEGEV